MANVPRPISKIPREKKTTNFLYFNGIAEEILSKKYTMPHRIADEIYRTYTVKIIIAYPPIKVKKLDLSGKM